MDLAGLGTLLLGVAALITAVAGLVKSKKASDNVSALRTELRQHVSQTVTLAQNPVINLFNYPADAGRSSTIGVGPEQPAPPISPEPSALPAPTPAVMPASTRRRRPRERES